MAASSEASWTWRLIPLALASFLAPSTSWTKKGLVWVETASTTVPEAADSDPPSRLQPAKPVAAIVATTAVASIL